MFATSTFGLQSITSNRLITHEAYQRGNLSFLHLLRFGNKASTT